MRTDYPTFQSRDPDPSTRNFWVRLIIGGTTIVVSIAAYFSYSVVRNSILENLKENARLEVAGGIGEVDKWLAQRKAEVATIANSPITRTMNWETVKPYLLSELQRRSDFFFFAMVNPDGSYYTTKVDLAKANIKDRIHIKKSLAGEVYVADPQLSRSLDIPVVFVTSPIWKDSSATGDPIGVTPGIINIDRLSEVIGTLQHGDGSYAFALNSAGEPIIHPDERLMGTKEKPAPSFLEAKDNDLQKITRSMVERQSNIELVELDGKAVYVAYAPLKQADWSIALVIPRQTIESQLRPLQIIAFVVGGLAIATITILWQVQVFEQKHLKKSKEAADAANRAKSEFLSNMSHELRTPLNGILGYAQILQRDRNLSNRQSDGLNIIQKSGQHLLTLINDILDLSKIEARKLELYPTDIHFPGFIESIAGIIRMRALEKDILFKYETKTTLPNGIYADEKRLRQVLLNLLGNAVKFTDTGSVILSVNSEKINTSTSLSAGNQQQIQTFRFEIIDTGVGISEEQQQKIFQPFEQVGDARRRDRGTGLGLAISRQLVELMGGEIQVKSELGRGSNFWFDVAFPIVDVQLSLATEVSGKIIGYSGERRTILVVDDKEENRLVLLDMLEPLGFTVELAEDGLQAVETTRKIQPDLILTDLVMPVMSGFEAIQEVRKIPEVRDTPIIAISASVLDMDRKRSRIAGCNDFLSKPVEEEKLLALVAEYLHLEWLYENIPKSSTIKEEKYSQTTGDFIIPPAEEIEVLYELAMIGSMKKIRDRAAYLEMLNDKYLPFADRLKDLAHGFQEEEIVALIEKYLNAGAKEE
ncbi:MAG: response regulator [Cyanobacteria bacterium SBLK]|nr:response regulator [Cyanobacteria bacterium SBLK]